MTNAMRLCQQCTHKNPFIDDNVEDLHESRQRK